MTNQTLRRLRRERIWLRIGLAIPVGVLVLLYTESAIHYLTYAVGMGVASLFTAVVLARRANNVTLDTPAPVKRIVRQLYGIDFLMIAWLGIAFPFSVKFGLSPISIIITLLLGLFVLLTIQWILEGKLRTSLHSEAIINKGDTR
ncbi:Uncharacterised protein [Exiguobacterium aurantiacum]|uniref:ATP synthase I chain n=2 Tax=Exiguobacterium aurantiacum TaxID=33987 RepID=A0A377FWQ7_9BACL|nr:Uncharacterised protein [Exiguobacterium aurantiacum]